MNKNDLKAAWLNFIQKEISDPEQTRAEILTSWARCKSNGVDPWKKLPDIILSEEELGSLTASKSRLIKLCAPYLETLYSIVRGSGFVIALTDENGVILTVNGDENIKSQIKAGEFREGAQWSEASIGTNAIGTALVTGAPIQVYSYEHYCRCAQVSTGSCAPIRDESNKIIGAVTLVGYDFNVHSHTLGMAVAASEAIRNSLILRNAQREVKLADSYKSTIMDCIEKAVLAVDPRGTVTLVNNNAKTLLRWQRDIPCIGKPLQDLLPGSNVELYTVLRERKQYTDKEITIVTAFGDERFSVTTRIISSNDTDFEGLVLVLDPIKRVRRIAHRMTGVVASMTFDDLAGKNPRYLETVAMAKSAGRSDYNVLLLGESGTGKDVFAQAIHNHSARVGGPFVAINCSAIPRELIASELFGYVEGAFTGARRGGSPGKFEFADGGTIFLDEIGDMPFDLQGHLLRVIEDHKVLRIGSHEPISVDVRIIAATNRDLLDDIRNKRFRQDLFYRLNVISIHMLPFRERMDDLEEMVHIIYRKLTSGLGLPERAIPESFLKALEDYPFPGNIRELQNIIERSIVMSSDGALSLEHLPRDVLFNRKLAPLSRDIGASASDGGDRDYVYSLLIKNKGNVSKSAQEMGIARTTLYRKMDRYGFTKSIDKR